MILRSIILLFVINGCFASQHEHVIVEINEEQPKVVVQELLMKVCSASSYCEVIPNGCYQEDMLGNTAIGFTALIGAAGFLFPIGSIERYMTQCVLGVMFFGALIYWAKSR